MASTFFGLEIAKTGLFISQKNMNLTGHNIANADTAGYTRQRIISESIDPNAGYMHYAPVVKGLVGGGVTVQTLERVRDSFIDRELRREYSDAGQYSVREDTWLYVDQLFNEFNDYSLSATMRDFFNSLNELSKDAASGEIRTHVQATAESLSQAMNYYYRKLDETRETMNDNMVATTERVNEILASVAEYSKHIYGYELSGEKANDLRDKRDVLLDELSQLMDVTYSEGTDRIFTLSTGDGFALVKNDEVLHTLYADDAAGSAPLVEIRLLNQGGADVGPLNYKSGKMQGYRQMRDGSTAEDCGIPYIMEQLNILARTIAQEINAVHETAYTCPQNGASTSGISLFWNGDTGSGADYTAVTAENFRLSDAVRTDPWKIACSKEAITSLNPDITWSNNVKMLELVQLVSSPTAMGAYSGSFESFLSGIVVKIGAEGGKLRTLNDSQSSVVLNLENRRHAMSSVNIDEEVTLLVQFQHAYTANSRMITAIDEALDVLINRTGIVGRG